MAQSDIFPALRSKLYDFASANSYEVAWPNKPFEPSESLYLRPAILPVGTTPYTMSSFDDHSGILQIDVIFKNNIGMGSAETAVELIQAEFSKGSVASAKSTDVLITNSYVSQMLDFDTVDEAWKFIPISINYRSFT